MLLIKTPAMPRYQKLRKIPPRFDLSTDISGFWLKLFNEKNVADFDLTLNVMCDGVNQVYREPITSPTLSISDVSN